MKIGAYINNEMIPNFDIHSINDGNPGIGGTEYMFYILLYNLHTKGHTICLYTPKNFNTDCFINIVVEDVHTAIDRADIDCLDFFLLRNGVDHPIFGARKMKTKFIMWAHNYMEYPELEQIAKCTNIVANVFVSRQMYDRYIDHDIIYKSTYIYNFVNTAVESSEPPNNKRVMFIGALVPAKGFHMLAKIWPKVLRKHPDAELYVMGSGTLYNRTLNVGDVPIADERYAMLIKNYLGSTLSKVHFLGNVCENKNDFISNCQIGVVNPTGATETFCISAVDFENCSIPVITCKRNGLLDVVEKDCGILIKSEKQLYKAIVELLSDYKSCCSLGKNGRLHAENNFNIINNVEKWQELLEQLSHNINFEYIAPTNHYSNNMKWAKVINRKIRILLRLSDTHSISYYRYILIRLLSTTYKGLSCIRVSKTSNKK